MKRFLLLLILLASKLITPAQTNNDSLIQTGTLQNIISYALHHQPAIQKSVIDEQITRSQVNSQLADWYPQIGFNYNLQHNFQLQKAVFQGQVIELGNLNTSTGNFSYTQNILNPNLVWAASTAKQTRKLASQITENNKIEAVANVSKAFYDVLLTRQQIQIAATDIVRLERSVNDAKNQYNSGIVDKSDYQRATILLNNATAWKRTNEEALKAKMQLLKALIGYPPLASLDLVYDSLQMEKEISFDAGNMPDYNNRIEYQVLQTQKKLKQANVLYSRYSFLPTVSGFADYNLNYYNNNISDLYKINYPNAYAGISIAFPIVYGGKRWIAIRQANWQLKKTDLDVADLKNNISAQYTSAMAAYNSSLANYTALKENMELAQQVYNVIQLQYRSGVKTYLEVINAESDLHASQINFYNSLYQLLSTKIDLLRSLGQLKY
jgi:outer membrane protein TolC